MNAPMPCAVTADLKTLGRETDKAEAASKAQRSELKRDPFLMGDQVSRRNAAGFVTDVGYVLKSNLSPTEKWSAIKDHYEALIEETVND